jgi:hypothetical protein
VKVVRRKKKCIRAKERIKQVLGEDISMDGIISSSDKELIERFFENIISKKSLYNWVERETRVHAYGPCAYQGLVSL